MKKKDNGLKRKLVRAGGWSLVRRVGKMIPAVGTAIAIGFVGSDIKKKGFVKGVVNSGLDAIPFVGIGKNIIEVFAGDMLADKEQTIGKRLPKKVKDEVRK